MNAFCLVLNLSELINPDYTQSELVASDAIDFLSLPWQDELLVYHTTAKARGRIHTPSYAQVVQPLCKSAIDRWRAYKHHLSEERTRLSN